MFNSIEINLKDSNLKFNQSSEMNNEQRDILRETIQINNNHENIDLDFEKKIEKNKIDIDNINKMDKKESKSNLKIKKFIDNSDDININQI